MDDFLNLRMGHHRLLCPECSDSRRYNKDDRTLSVEVQQNKILWKCWHCDYQGVRSRYEEEEEHYVEETPTNPLHEGYLFSRGISKSTAGKYGVTGAEQYIRKTGTTVECAAFPYYTVEGDFVGFKYRGISVKGFSCSAPLKDLWRIDLVNVEECKDIIITEGEIDALSIADAGFKNVVSIPNGATASSTNEAAYGFIWNAKEKIDKAERIVLAGDADKVGKEAQEEIARRIGKYKVWRVVWPEGIKDANDALLRLGMAGLKALIEAAEPWPVSGLYGAEHFDSEVMKVFKEGLKPGESTGYPMLDEIYTIAPGLLTVVTGVPNAGKSEFIDQLMVNLAERAGWSFSLCSFENPPHIHIHKLVAKRLRLNTWKKKVDEKDFNEAKWWVQQHFSFLYDSDGNLSSLDSIIDRLRVAVMRYGIRGVVIDPYNYIQRPRDSTETDWISDMLTKIKTFAMAHGVHVWFCAHPTKMQPVDGGKIAIPTGYNISGSAHFFNKADCGLTVHREEGNELVQIKVWKMRFAWQGKLGKVSLLYDRDTTTYSDGNGNFEALDDGEAWI